MGYTLYLDREEYGICRLEPSAPVPAWATTSPFYTISRTEDELSILCPVRHIPPNVLAERGWRKLKVAGPLDFGQVGVLAALASPLAEAGISIFVISTYDTDYLFVPSKDLTRALAVLHASGHRVR